MKSYRNYGSGQARKSDDVRAVPFAVEEAIRSYETRNAYTDRKVKHTTEHDGLVFRACKKYHWGMRQCGIDFDDLVQAGRIGVLRAIETFDPALGYKFSTYANHWIHHYIRREAQNNGRTVRVPVQSAVMAWKKGKDIGTRRIAADHWQPRNGDPVGDMSFFDIIGHIAQPSADEDLEASELRATLERAMRKLTERERDIIQARFFRHRTLEDAGASHGVTRERCRQIEKGAIDKLRHALRRLAKEYSPTGAERGSRLREVGSGEPPRSTRRRQGRPSIASLLGSLTVSDEVGGDFGERDGSGSVESEEEVESHQQSVVERIAS